jgi:hypothetical protein
MEPAYDQRNRQNEAGPDLIQGRLSFVQIVFRNPPKTAEPGWIETPLNSKVDFSQLRLNFRPFDSGELLCHSIAV